jgi:hypothetical protein
VHTEATGTNATLTQNHDFLPEATADLRLLLASASVRGAAACSSFYAPQQQQKALKNVTKSAIDVAKVCDRLP